MNPRDIKLEFFDPQLDDKEDKPGRFRAVICADDASRTTGNIWKDENARLVWYQQWGSGNLGWALCRRLEPDIGLGVWIEFNHALQQYEVMEDDNIQRDINSSRSSYLAPTEKDFLPAGRFQLWINDKMIQPLAIYPGSSGLTISIVSGDYIYGGDRKTYNGTIDYDISASQPAGPTEHLFVGFYLDSNNALQTINGATVSTGSTATEPAWPAGAFRLGVVDLDDSQTTITITDITNRKVVWTEDGGTSGLTSNVWPQADEVNIDNTSYATWALAIDALAASDQAIIGEGTYDSDNERIDTASYVLGSGVDVSILETASAVSVLTLAKALIYLENITLQNTYGPSIYGNVYAAYVTEDCSLDAFRVKFQVTGASADDNMACYIASGGTHRLDNCIFLAQNGATNYGLYIDTVEGIYSAAIVHLFDPDVTGDVTINDGELWIYGGSINGNVIAGDGATIYLSNLPLITGTVTEVGTGQVLGYYIDETGTIYPAIGWPFTVKNQQTGVDYNTITAAIAAATAGDTLLIGDDITEDVTITKNLIIRGMSSEITITGAGVANKVIYVNAGTTLDLENIRIVSAYTGDPSYGISMDTGAVSTLRGVKIEVATGSSTRIGVSGPSGSPLSLLEDCEVSVTGGVNTRGVLLSNATLTGGIISATGGSNENYDLYLNSGTNTVRKAILINNTIRVSIYVLKGEWWDGNGVTHYAEDSTPADGEVPTWSAANSRWEPTAPTGNVWADAGKVNISTTEYATWALANAALGAGDQAIIGKGSQTSTAESVANGADIRGSGIDVSVLTGTGLQTLILNDGTNVLQDFNIENTATGGRIALRIGSSGGADATCINIKGKSTATSGTATGIDIYRSDAILIDCIAEASGGSSNRALYYDDSATGTTVKVYGGDYTGSVTATGANATLKIYGSLITGNVTQTSSATLELYGPKITGTLSGTWSGYYYDANDDLHLDADEAAIKQRSIDIYTTSITDHYDGSSFTGYTWAAYAGFVTPANIDLSSYPSMAAIWHSDAQATARSFGYRSSYGATILCRCVNTADTRTGLRMDDGTNNNYAELFLEYIAGGLTKVRYRYSIGGVPAGPTDIWATAVPAQFTVLQMLRSGDLVLFYTGINSPVLTYHTAVSVTGWSPTRSGIYHESLSAVGNSLARSSIFDWYKQ